MHVCVYWLSCLEWGILCTNMVMLDREREREGGSRQVSKQAALREMEITGEGRQKRTCFLARLCVLVVPADNARYA